MKKIVFFMSLVAVALLSSCSETSDEDTEFANWKSRNEAYFAQVYAQAKQAIETGDTSWRIIRGYSKGETTTEPTNHIVVKVLSEGGTGIKESPIYTDSVKVHYRGYYMPSASYNTSVTGYPQNVGYQFDSSWVGKYNIAAMQPSKGVVGSFVDGYTTALQYMHPGDRWLVFIPYKLGYGESDYNSILGGSTLIFDMTLDSFWKKRL